MVDANRATAAADVYGLAMTAIMALYGANLPPEVLFDRARFLESLGVEDIVRSVLARGIAHRAEDRWRSAEEFCRQLEAAALSAGEFTRPAD